MEKLRYEGGGKGRVGFYWPECNLKKSQAVSFTSPEKAREARSTGVFKQH